MRFGHDFWLEGLIDNASELHFAKSFKGHPTWPYLARSNTCPNTVFGVHIWARQIWSSGVPWKDFTKCSSDAMFGIQDDVCWWNIRWEQIIAKSIQVGTRVRKLRWLVGSTEVVEKTKGRMPGFLRVILSPGCITTEQLLCNASWWCRSLPCVFQSFVFHWIDWRKTKRAGFIKQRGFWLFF